MEATPKPALVSRYRPTFEVDPRLTLAALRMGPLDEQVRIDRGGVMRATWTAAGPASVRLSFSAGQVLAEGWGQGAEAAIAEVPDLLGAADHPEQLVPRHPLVSELVRRFAGVRMTKTGKILETLVPSIIGQKVTGLEAWRAHRALLRRFGEPAPGPLGLRLPPRPAVLAGTPYFAYHALGLERRRADAIRHAARLSAQLEATVALPREEARRRLLSVAGIGPWTAAETLRLATGDPDAVSVGDYNLPNLVCWALAGERRGTDERMLELLEPYAGQRARVVRLIELSGLHPARRGPRLAPRSLTGI
jgi:3-methyladenine DNA glycosylase/8-oxoguanine DNA glycosylase